MKKTILSALFAILYFASASAEVGVTVGVSGQVGLFAASGQETQTGEKTDKHTGSEHGEVGYGSVFLEAKFDRVAVGVDFVPGALETETTESIRLDKTTSSTASSSENKVQIDFEELTTLYLAVDVLDSMYIKAGYMSVDVITNENLATGSSYGNTDLDGTMVGVGYATELANGIQLRVEGNYLTFDGASLTSNDNTVKINQLDGVTGKVSLAKSF